MEMAEAVDSEEAAVAASEEAAAVASEEAAAVAASKEILAQERCTRQYVLIVEQNAKSLSSQ
jgi:hypothetical protein